MNIAIGIAIIVFAVFALNIGIGMFLGSATGDMWHGAKVGAVIATLIGVTFGLIVAGVLVMIQ